MNRPSTDKLINCWEKRVDYVKIEVGRFYDWSKEKKSKILWDNLKIEEYFKSYNYNYDKQIKAYIKPNKREINNRYGFTHFSKLDLQIINDVLKIYIPQIKDVMEYEFGLIDRDEEEFNEREI